MAVAHYSEYSSGGPRRRPVSFCHADTGWRDASSRAIYQTAVKLHPDAFKLFPGSERFLPRLEAGQAIAAFRSEMCNDDQWYRSHVYNEFRRLAFNDDYIVSIIPRGRHEFSVLDVNQDPADPRPTERTKRLLVLIHRTIFPFVARELATEEHFSLAGLSPRLRGVLAQLLEGSTEKQVAANLDICLATAHEHIGKLYRHFGVRSRAELMAYFIRRRPECRPSLAR